MAPKRNHVLVRLARVLHLCQTRRILPPVDDLARDLGCHPRTVYRLLAAIEEAHIPVPLRRGRDAGDMRQRRSA